ncbi:MAG: TIGR00266 family protein, partial [Candidatus Electrothrix sp. AR3]|nr:TIGR00266 family protein [Candidatus Electrothrix sp. AR3]
MNIDIVMRPGNAAAKVTLEPHEQLISEGGAMISMSGDTQIETT